MSLSPRHDYWTAVLAQFRRSAMTQSEFCRSRHLSIHTFRQWLYRLRDSAPITDQRRTRLSISRKSAPVQPEKPAFVPVRIRPERSGAAQSPHDESARSPLEVVLGHDLRVRIPVGFDPATLRQLLEVLERHQ